MPDEAGRVEINELRLSLLSFQIGTTKGHPRECPYAGDFRRILETA
jgi:hypothetical protein